MQIGKKSEESQIKLYQGIASLNVVAVNPTKEELSKILGREMSKDMEYTGTDENGKKYVDLAFWCKTDSNSAVNGKISICLPLFIRLVDSDRTKKDGSKVQVIDKYGRSAWPTIEEAEKGAIPQYSSGPASISEGYHKAMPGEETLMELLKKWLNIPDLEVWNSTAKKREPNKDVSPADCEMGLDFKKLLAGDWSELKGLVDAAKDYAFKAVIGVKNRDGKQREQIYTGKFMKNGASTFDGFTAAITASQASGSYSTTEFDTAPLHEYCPKATDFSQTQEGASAANPWDNN